MRLQSNLWTTLDTAKPMRLFTKRVIAHALKRGLLLAKAVACRATPCVLLVPLTQSDAITGEGSRFSKPPFVAAVAEDRKVKTVPIYLKGAPGYLRAFCVSTLAVISRRHKAVGLCPVPNGLLFAAINRV